MKVPLSKIKGILSDIIRLPDQNIKRVGYSH